MGKNKVGLFVIVLLVTLLASCVTNKQTVYLQDKSAFTPRLDSTRYRVMANDELTFRFTGSDQEVINMLNGGMGQNTGSSTSRSVTTYRVYEEGNVYLPVVGSLHVEGLTLRQINHLAEAKFQAMVPDLRVRASLVNDYFYILGDNGKGQFPIDKNGLTIFEALAMGGDLSKMADRKIKILRPTRDGSYVVNVIDLRANQIIDSDLYYIHPNDIVYLPTTPSSFFRITSFASLVSVVMSPIQWLLLALSIR